MYGWGCFNIEFIHFLNHYSDESEGVFSDKEFSLFLNLVAMICSMISWKGNF